MVEDVNVDVYGSSHPHGPPLPAIRGRWEGACDLGEAGSQPVAGTSTSIRSAAILDQRLFSYPFSQGDASFAETDLTQWLSRGFVRKATGMFTRAGHIFPSFVVNTA